MVDVGDQTPECDETPEVRGIEQRWCLFCHQTARRAYRQANVASDWRSEFGYKVGDLETFSSGAKRRKATPRLHVTRDGARQGRPTRSARPTESLPILFHRTWWVMIRTRVRVLPARCTLPS
eukprot:scaffold165926_cov27-Tisochrysis_lutea.AAC.4